MKGTKGQISVIVLFVILIAGVLFFTRTKPPPPVEREQCAVVDENKEIQYNNESYIRIRGVSPLSTEQFKFHVKEESEKIDGKTVFVPKSNCELVSDAENGSIELSTALRDSILDRTNPSSYVNQCENDTRRNVERAASASYEGLGKKDMIFLQDETPRHEPGYIFTEVYLRKRYYEDRARQLPEFIQRYCDNSQPVEKILLFPNSQGVIYPPAYIIPQDISPPRNSNDVYTIFAYERSDSLWGKVHGNRHPSPTPAREIVGTYRYHDKTYIVNEASYAGYLTLYDELDPTYVYLYSKIIPTPTPIPPLESRKTLQVNRFNPFILEPWGWWSPECKPAIYLYPEKETAVQVKVNPAGHLTYTDPVYPSSGWKAQAYPSGKIVVDGKEFEYLYYESKIKDSAIDKPSEGYVVAFEDLPDWYSMLLPRLGLSSKETRDFKQYWEGVLPKSPYYFVGIMNDAAIEKIEPLTIVPKPDTIIRVRLYFEALNEKKSVRPPIIPVLKRSGFVLVEWGGIVKLHPGTEFSCSQ